MNEKAKIGVYICHCGGNISDTVDVAKVKEAVSKLEGVKVVEKYEYVCSDPGQEMIKKGIKDNGLNRIVVASCSPLMHLDTFRRAVESAGLNPYLLEMANIREQCSWIHGNKEEATAKAIDIIRNAVARARHLEPLTAKSIPVKKDTLVIGGGIAGITAAIELADKGYKVNLIERSPSIGGHMAQLSKTYPTLDCSQCILTPKMVSAAQNPNINLITMAEVQAIEGSPGNYRVLVKKRPRFVNASNCTACGECEKVCPVKVPSEFDSDLSVRKAIYSPFKQAVPKTYVIDKENCLYFTKGVCKLCEKFCKGKAINFNQKEETIELDVGSIVSSTGFDLVDPKKFPEYKFGSNPDVITNLQLERLIGQEMKRPSDKKVAKKVAFILCVGSRMKNKEGGVEHCCKIGCMASIKQAMLVQKVVPDAEPWIFYTDIRADGKGYEEFYAKARDHSVRFVRGRVSEVMPLKNGELLVKAEDTLVGCPIEGSFDLVVLVLGITPALGAQELAKKLGVQIGSDEFFVEKHYKLKPVDSQREGIFISGCAVSPKDIRETTLESSAVASRVATFLGKGEISVSPEVARIDSIKCDSCGICIKACPVAAIEKTQEGVTVNSISCVGCGICLPKCPKEAIDLDNWTEEQLMAQIHSVSDYSTTPKLVAFLEKEIAYGSADLAGQSRATYPANVKIIRVPTTGRIGLKHLLHAFAYGADGVVMLEDHGGVFSEEALREHINQLKKELSAYKIEPMRLISYSTTLPEYNKIVNTFEVFNTRISKMGPLKEDIRKNIMEKISVPQKIQSTT